MGLGYHAGVVGVGRARSGAKEGGGWLWCNGNTFVECETHDSALNWTDWTHPCAHVCLMFSFYFPIILSCFLITCPCLTLIIIIECSLVPVLSVKQT